MTPYSKSSVEKGKTMRTNLVTKIAMLESLLHENLSTYSRVRLIQNLRAAKKQLEVLDTEGERAVINRMINPVNIEA